MPGRIKGCLHYYLSRRRQGIYCGFPFADYGIRGDGCYKDIERELEEFLIEEKRE